MIISFYVNNAPLATIEAYRPTGVDYTVYESRVLEESGVDDKALHVKPQGSARSYYKATLPKATAWKSIAVMQERFEKNRDKRFMTLSDDPDFPRRISWLYPKGGCFARASIFNRNAFHLFIPVPNKVFAFENLQVRRCRLVVSRGPDCSVRC